MTVSRAMRMDMVYLFFDAANMHRWNDRIRPVDLTELDKQSHKAAIAWILGKYEEDAGKAVDWRALMEGLVFSFMERAVLTDLKPELLHRIERERRGALNAFVLSEVDRHVPGMDAGLRGRFRAFLESDGSSEEERIVNAAHYLATRWEFRLIRQSNSFLYGMETISAKIDAELGDHRGMAGVARILEDRTFGFVDLIGQLRFQQRWTRTPRIPQTTVLGHSMIVAVMTYLHDLDAGVGDRQAYNDFFTALFHDLPEVLTKDVITPVKTSIDGLVELLEEYEHELLESVILPLIPEGWQDEFRFLVFDPFADSDDPVHGMRNGGDIKACDTMAAYIEANVSRRYGVTSKTLSDGERDLRSRLERIGDRIDAKELMDQLDRMRI